MIHRPLNKELALSLLIALGTIGAHMQALTPEEVLKSGIDQLQAQHRDIVRQLEQPTLNETTKAALEQKKTDLERSLAILAPQGETLGTNATSTSTTPQVIDHGISSNHRKSLDAFQAWLKDDIEHFFYNSAPLAIEDRIAVTKTIYQCKEEIRVCKESPKDNDAQTIALIEQRIDDLHAFMEQFENVRLSLELFALPLPLSSEHDTKGFLTFNSYHTTCVKLFSSFYQEIIINRCRKNNAWHEQLVKLLIATCPIVVTTKSLKKVMVGTAASYLAKVSYDVLSIDVSKASAHLHQPYKSIITAYYGKNPVGILLQQKDFGALLEQTITECFDQLAAQGQTDNERFVIQRMLDKLITIKTDFERICITTVAELTASRVKKEIYMRYQVLIRSSIYQLFARTYPDLNQQFMSVIEAFFKEKEKTSSLTTWYSLNRAKFELTNRRGAIQGGLYYRIFHQRDPIVEPMDEIIALIDLMMGSIKEAEGPEKSVLLSGLATAAVGLAPAVAGKLDALLKAYLGTETSSQIPLPSQEHLAAVLQMYPKVLDELCKTYPEFSKLRTLVSPQTYTPLFVKA